MFFNVTKTFLRTAFIIPLHVYISDKPEVQSKNCQNSYETKKYLIFAEKAVLNILALKANFF